MEGGGSKDLSRTVSARFGVNSEASFIEPISNSEDSPNASSAAKDEKHRIKTPKEKFKEVLYKVAEILSKSYYYNQNNLDL